jgi:hypothetical protein
MQAQRYGDACVELEFLLERGKIAGWIAPPAKGISGQPFDFDYVRL